MNMRSRKYLFAIVLLIALVGLLSLKIHSFLVSPASSSITSESGRYVMENVHVGGVLVAFEDLAYLRVIDKKMPGVVFRSPLYSLQSLDMRSHEDDMVVGIVWIDFFKHSQTFSIGAPEWSEHWLNVFISNTPYEVIEN